jgi:adenylate kinase
MILLGPPGSGKGTQARRLAAEMGIPAVSTGELLRAEVASGTPLGSWVKATVETGGLVADDVVNQLIDARLRRPDAAGGIILDGYPRTVEQAEFLGDLLSKLGLPAPVVVSFEIGPEVLITRLGARRQCPECGRVYHAVLQPPEVNGLCDVDGTVLVQRKDDQPDVIRRRLELYQHATAPLRDYYRAGDYHEIDATQDAAIVTRDALATIGVHA